LSQRILKRPRNEAGRDFVVGDIHFKTADLQRGLRSLDFDSKVDRVIGVGDLIDRGPGVLEGLSIMGTISVRASSANVLNSDSERLSTIALTSA
jgi:serine/threonine protein phosphatase 1